LEGSAPPVRVVPPRFVPMSLKALMERDGAGRRGTLRSAPPVAAWRCMSGWGCDGVSDRVRRRGADGRRHAVLPAAFTVSLNPRFTPAG